MDAVRLVEVRGSEWTIAVDVVEVEGGGTKVLERKRIRRRRQIIGPLVEREVVVYELTDVREAGVDVIVLLGIGHALGGFCSLFLGHDLAGEEIHVGSRPARSRQGAEQPAKTALHACAGRRVLIRIFRHDWRQDRGGDDPGRDQTDEHVSPKTHLLRRHWDPLRKVSPSTPSNGPVARIGGSASAVVYLMRASPSEVQDICDATT